MIWHTINTNGHRTEQPLDGLRSPEKERKELLLELKAEKEARKLLQKAHDLNENCAAALKLRREHK